MWYPLTSHVTATVAHVDVITTFTVRIKSSALLHKDKNPVFYFKLLRFNTARWAYRSVST